MLAQKLFAHGAGVYSEDPRREKPGTPMGHALVAATGDDDPEAPTPSEQEAYAREIASRWNALSGVRVQTASDGAWLHVDCGPQKASLNLGHLAADSVHGPIIRRALNHLVIQIGNALRAAPVTTFPGSTPNNDRPEGESAPEARSPMQDQQTVATAGQLSLHARIEEARAHLGAALVQSISSDDQIIMNHVRTAYALLGGV